ncbi:hypothetical protein O206_05125 [Ochrobactrum sp. EGD-AQ16]|nr:hypothetical protein O206_05125 [Ochrobactrum sp. EGD-AQ16]
MVAAARGVAAAIITTIMVARGDKGRKVLVVAARTRHLISKIFCARAKTV